MKKSFNNDVLYTGSVALWLIGVILLILRLAEIILIPWWIVCIPLALPILIFIAIAVVILVIAYIDNKDLEEKYGKKQ